MTSPELPIGIISNTDPEGHGAFIMLKPFQDSLVVVVSQEQNGDAEIVLSAIECERLIHLLSEGISRVLAHPIDNTSEPS